YLAAPIGAAIARPPEEWPIDGALFLRGLACLALLAAAGALAYRVSAALSLAYAVDRNGVYIFWLGNRAVVPLQAIESIERGVAATAAPLRGVGYFHGRATLPGGRTLHRFTTVPTERALVLHTAVDSYAISPQESEAFVQDLEQRRRLGAVQQLAPGVEAGRAFFYAFWDDRVVRAALLAAVALNLALLGWLMTIYPGLPATLDLRSDAVGVAATFAPRHQILFLPLAGAALGLLNTGLGLTLYAREPVGARLLQVASAGVQILFAVAAVSILL
ncbi:MAG TPA: PH domain-containing protein, partial [Chloroflexaceae bacterium]|nr:PH domain-containing protein [Chloroflexaceae bacterium]